MNPFPNGIWPTMLTPFTDENKIDYCALEKLISWYRSHNVSGLFAACQSSEIFHLSLRERVQLVRFVKQMAGTLPVIASGHVSDDPEDQAVELNAIAEAGADAVILISNRLASPEESDDVFLANLSRLLSKLPEALPLGFYECPYPYKRLLPPPVIRYCVDSGRFYFLKDTSCTLKDIREKLALINGSDLKLYNANTATLLDSLMAGASGYSGVMANVQPELYVWLVEHYRTNSEQAQFVQSILTACSWLESKHYPDCAKAFLQLSGIPMNAKSRKDPECSLNSTEWDELRQLKGLTDALCGHLVSRGINRASE